MYVNDTVRHRPLRADLMERDEHAQIRSVGWRVPVAGDLEPFDWVAVDLQRAADLYGELRPVIRAELRWAFNVRSTVARLNGYARCQHSPADGNAT